MTKSDRRSLSGHFPMHFPFIEGLKILRLFQKSTRELGIPHTLIFKQTNLTASNAFQTILFSLFYRQGPTKYYAVLQFRKHEFQASKAKTERLERELASFLQCLAKT